MSFDDISKQLTEALERAAADHEMDLVEVEVVGAERQPTVRVRIDHADESAPPIDLDEVSAQNEWISGVIDLVDPFPGSYTLEVSSPGLARPLRRPRDFERFAGSEVTLQTTATEGRKRFSGTLEGFESGSVVLTVDGTRQLVPLDQVKRCKIKPAIDFSQESGSKAQQ
jgi:ribosome maturation factor RimP